MAESVAISIFDRKLEETKHKLLEPGAISLPDCIPTCFSNLFQAVKSKHDHVGAPSSDPMEGVSPLIQSLMGMMGNFAQQQNGNTKSESNSQGIMQMIPTLMQSFKSLAGNVDEILTWRETADMQQLLTLDPRARYMYLSPTPLLPSLSGLYLELTLESTPIYVLFASRQPAPLIYTENILTQEFVRQIYEEQKTTLGDYINQIPTDQLDGYMNPDAYWTFIDAKLAPPTPTAKTAPTSTVTPTFDIGSLLSQFMQPKREPVPIASAPNASAPNASVPNRRRPVYNEDL